MFYESVLNGHFGVVSFPHVVSTIKKIILKARRNVLMTDESGEVEGLYFYMLKHVTFSIN